MRTFISALVAFFLGSALFSSSTADAHSPTYHQMQVRCLALNIYHEVRSESLRSQTIVTLIVLGRADEAETSPCREVFRYAQFSWANSEKLYSEPKDYAAWALAEMLAHDVYHNRHLYKMPKGWECVRFFKRSDNLGVSEKSKRIFAKLIAVGPFDLHTGYRTKHNCTKPLRST